ncbi:MAG: protocatechuate 3,4-dioxygenase beta subunit [Bradymonadia bacterium]|jgi:protocatechuate 3,4-dioxygenase beta subunit
MSPISRRAALRAVASAATFAACESGAAAAKPDAVADAVADTLLPDAQPDAAIVDAAGDAIAEDTAAEVAEDVAADAQPDAPVDVCEDRTGAQVEGPFYPGEPVERMNITEDREGVAWTLDIEVQAQGSCEPLANAEVDVWSADAEGSYSGYDAFGTVGESWLRGQQITNAEGKVGFTLVVPGAYPGRAIHAHVKVRAEGRAELTTQVYLDDAVVAEVLRQPTYAGSSAQTTNGRDGFYAPDTLTETTGTVAEGFASTITVIV